MQNLLKLILTLILFSSLTNASETIPTQEEVAKLYVATFNRAPDSAGLSYWVNNSGLTLSGIARSFFVQDETQTLYPAGTTVSAFIQSVYQNLFNRAPKSAGLSYWEDDFNLRGRTRDSFILAMINGALDNADGMDKTILDNKTSVGLYFSFYGYNDVYSAKDAMRNITADFNTVVEAKDSFYLKSGSEITDSCILNILYSDFTNATLCYESIGKDSCNQIQDSDDEAFWYGFAVKGKCLDLQYPANSLFSDDDGDAYYAMAGLYPGKVQGNDNTDDTYEEKTISISEDNLEATHEKAKIKFSSNDIDTTEDLTIQRATPKPISLGDEVGTNYKAIAYDFTLNGKTNFIDLVTITLGYDSDFTDFIDNSKDEEANIIAKYYNPTSGEYEPVDYIVDTTNKEVKILTNHLSEYALFVTANGERYGAFKVTNNNSRKAYITATDAYYRFVDSDVAVNIINDAISNNMTATNQGYEVGFSKANEWLGIVAAGNTLASSPFSSTFLTSLGNSFNAVGVGASILQAGFDFANGDIVSLYSNLSKNVVYNSVNYFGTSALQLAFVGVFAIDYSLSAFANEAWDGSNEKWHKTYNRCYDKHFSKRPKEWYKTFYWIWHDTKDFGQAKEKIDKAINDNVFAVWDKLTPSDRVECMDDLGYTNLGGDNTSLEISLALAKKSELVAGLAPVFDRLEKRIMRDLRAKHKAKLEEVRNALNQKINAQIKETVETGKTASYAGYKFRFSPLNNTAKKAEWTGTLDSSGAATGAWRVLGYMQAGSPNKLELFKPKDNPDTATPVKTVEFTITPPNLVINIGSSNDTTNDTTSTVAYDSCPLISDGSTYIFVDKTNHKMYYNPDSASEYLQSKHPKNYFYCTYHDDTYELYYASYYENSALVLDQEWYRSGNADGLEQHVKYNEDYKNHTWQRYDIVLEEQEDGSLVPKYVFTKHGTL